MTEPDHVVIGRLSHDFAVLASHLARASADLQALSRIVTERPTTAWQAGPPVSPWSPPPSPATTPLPPQPVMTPTPPVTAAPPVTGPVPPRTATTGPGTRNDGWIGKVLAVAGVVVTLVGVVLLLVLAAQAGLLAPGVRVGAGAVLAAGLTIAGWRLHGRPGGRVGAIALAATGIAAAYVDVIAVTAVYGFLPPAAGLVVAASVAGSGLLLARQWNSEHLGMLVVVPLIGLAPMVGDGVTLLVVGFLLALAAASLPIQLGRSWTGLHVARIATATVPLLVALIGVDRSSADAGWLAGAAGIGAVLAILGALLSFPTHRRPVVVAAWSAAGTVPVLSLGAVTGRVTAAALAAMLAGSLLGIVLAGGRIPGLTEPVRRLWSGLAAVAALVAVTAAFDGPVAGPVLLAMAVVTTVAGRAHPAAWWSALGFAVVGGAMFVATAPVDVLFDGLEIGSGRTVSTLVSSVLAVACAVATAWSWTTRTGRRDDVARLVWLASGVVALYAVTMFTVTAGVWLGGGNGFYAGHVVATTAWIGLAAAALRAAAHLPRADRSLPMAAGMTVVAAAVAKLFVFDLGTLDGMFRVAVFIVVGLVLLGTGAGYARRLSQQDSEV
ncbi:DUF2339 domain-containing protein [Mycolicibacterium grossiae]|uniref:DUF2339 domain-containing protein n=1 Tax=Mycolicibacterium grossiae TaxID=1552759 RepID=A0A1E8PXE8_9MYCO|nr:DUF2339 domain-containing protein [Mycolicibacterium grossiae]OFJ50756.1 hypothetical protein BEL07_26440 [Mycolicibacterium grossiae]QEM46582.1 DUF2339 domain-containing protein [Mycolicibacterium grossiae]